MSNINKQALREAAGKAISEEGETWWNEEQLATDYGLALHRADANFIAAANPATVLALLDELEAAEKRIAELEVREVKLPEAMMPARHNSGELFMSPDNVEYGGYLNRDDVVRNLRAAGIIAKVGEQGHG